MALQLPHLVAYCQEMSLKRLAIGECFLMSYFPARRPRRAPAQGIPLVALQVHRGLGQGRGMVGARCLEHGAPSCDWCRCMWYGRNWCC